MIDFQYPVYQPAMRTITAITNAFPALVTTNINHNYVTGQWVRIIVPETFGMVQINKMQGYITVTSPTQFTIELDTIPFDAFVVPADRVYPEGPTSQVQYAQVIPIGERYNQFNAAVKNVLPYP